MDHAFPCSHPDMPQTDPRWVGGGMSFLDYAAVKIAASYISDISINPEESNHAKIAAESYLLALALDAERAKYRPVA